MAERDNQVVRRHAAEGMRFLNALTPAGHGAPDPQAPGPGMRHNEIGDNELAAGRHGQPRIPLILDSFAPARHKFGHWRGRFGPRELLRR